MTALSEHLTFVDPDAASPYLPGAAGPPWGVPVCFVPETPPGVARLVYADGSREDVAVR